MVAGVERVMQAVMKIAHRIIVLDHGAKIAEGQPEEVVKEPAVIEAYPGPRYKGLAPKVVDEVFEKIQEVRHTGITILIVEQSVVSGLSISDRGYVVQNGTVLLEDSARNLLTNEMVRAAYLGL